MTNSEENLNELYQKYTEAKKYGLDVQKEGIKIVRNADTGLEAIEFLKSQKAPFTPEINSWIASANATTPHPPANLTDLSKYSLAVGVTTGSSLIAVNKLSQDIPQTEKESSLIKSSSYSIEELDKYLEHFKDLSGIDLVSLRKGAWDVFHSNVAERLVFASHGMREILSKVISQWATNERVKEAKWWKLVEDTESGVSQRQRLQYLIFGPNIPEDDNTLDMVEATVKMAFEAHDRLKKIAHLSNKSKLEDEVKKAMQVTEISLLTIFQARKLKGITLIISGKRIHEDVDGEAKVSYCESLSSGNDVCLTDCSIENIFIPVKCDCGSVDILEAEDFDKQVVDEDRGMGIESSLWTTAYGVCPVCKNNLSIEIMLDEYPMGIYRFEKDWIDNPENCQCCEIPNLKKLVKQIKLKT